MSKFTYKWDEKAGQDKFALTRDNLRQLDPRVFETAAQLISDNVEKFTCCALDTAFEKIVGNYYGVGVYNDAWRAVFGPSVIPTYGTVRPLNHPFWNAGVALNSKITPEIKQARMTSLAMMAAMIRDAKASRGAKKPKNSQK